MKKTVSPFRTCVKTLTLVSILLINSGCVFINSRYGESCKTHAHVRVALADYLNRRYHSNSPVRLAVIPFSAPANLTAYNVERPGIGNQLAWRLQALFLADGSVPLVEILNRQDWPGKKEEFFTGNFGAIQAARQAGYDLVLLGLIEPPSGGDTLLVHSKLIEPESGVTLWYGTIESWTRRPEMASLLNTIYLQDKDPSQTYLKDLVEKSARCTVKAITNEEMVPG